MNHVHKILCATAVFAASSMAHAAVIFGRKTGKNGDRPHFLVLAGQNTGETYLLNSLEINGGAAASVPTTGTLALAMLGLAGLRLRKQGINLRRE